MQEVDTERRWLHILVCVNDRPPTGLPACQDPGEEIYETLHKWVSVLGMSHNVWVNKAGCLGMCHPAGATVALYPDGPILQGVTMDDLEDLLTTYVEPVIRERATQGR